LKDTKCDSRYR